MKYTKTQQKKINALASSLNVGNLRLEDENLVSYLNNVQYEVECDLKYRRNPKESQMRVEASKKAIADRGLILRPQSNRYELSD